MAAETAQLEKTRDELQRREWLLLEFLSSDRKTRKVYDEEIARSMERVSTVAGWTAELAQTPAVVEDGTPDCERITRVKGDMDAMMKARVAEVDTYYLKTFRQLWGCEGIATSMTNVHASLRKPDVTEGTRRAMMLALDFMTGPNQMAASVTGPAFQTMVGHVEMAPNLTPRQRYAYFGYSCLKRSQRQTKGLQSPDRIEAGLALCDDRHWMTLGPCVSALAQPRKT